MKGKQWLHLPGCSLSSEPHTAQVRNRFNERFVDENINSLMNETKATNFSVEPQFQDEAVKGIVQTKGKEMHSALTPSTVGI